LTENFYTSHQINNTEGEISISTNVHSRNSAIYLMQSVKLLQMAESKIFYRLYFLALIINIFDLCLIENGIFVFTGSNELKMINY